MTTVSINRTENSSEAWNAQELIDLMAPDANLRLLFRNLEYKVCDISGYHASVGLPTDIASFNLYFDEAQTGVTRLASGTHDAGINWSTSISVSDSGYGLLNRDPKPAYISSDDYYSWEAVGFLYVPVSGTYLMSLGSDDASVLEIDGAVIASKLPGGGFYQMPAIYPVTLTAGRHTIRAAMIEFGGVDGISVAWSAANASLVQGLQYTWYDTSALYARVGHPTTTAGLDEFFGGADTVLMGTGVYNERLAWAGVTTAANPVPKPTYLPADGFSWRVDGYIYIDVPGTYQFFIGGDDAVDLTIDGVLVAHHYGGHGYRHPGYADATITPGSMTFDKAGYYSLTARQEEGAGGEAINVQWIKPGQSAWSIIPAAHYKQKPTNFTTPTVEQLSGYEYSGYRVSPPLSLDGILGYEDSVVTWTETLNGQSIEIESSIDGGATWTPCIDGGPVPGLIVGSTLKNVSVLLRQTFSTDNHRQTPQLSSLSVEVVGQDTVCKVWEDGVWKSVKLRQWDDVANSWVDLDPGIL